MKTNRSQGRCVELRADLRTQQGFTLIELMIGLVITLVIIGGAFTVLTSTEQFTKSNERTVDTQQNVRVAMDLMARDIKMAGFGMVGAVGTCAIGGTPAAIVPVNSTSGPDQIRVVAPLGSAASPSWTIANVGGVGGPNGFSTLDLPAGAMANMTAAGLGIGSVISLAGVVTTTVTAVSGNTISFTGTSAIPGPAAFPAGTPVYLLQCVTYDVGTTLAACGNGSTPCLRRNGFLIADGVEDIQFEYACDGCVSTVNSGVADGIVDDWPTSPAGYDATDFISNNAWATTPVTPDKIRVARIFIVARQTVAEQSGTQTAGALSVSDHNHALGVFAVGDYAGLNPPYSRYKRRVLTRTVDVRNIGQ